MSNQQKQAFLASGQIISMSEAAALTPYSAEYLSLLARTGKLQAVKVGRNWVTTHNAVQSYLQHQREKHQKMLHSLHISERMAV